MIYNYTQIHISILKSFKRFNIFIFFWPVYRPLWFSIKPTNPISIFSLSLSSTLLYSTIFISISLVKRVLWFIGSNVGFVIVGFSIFFVCYCWYCYVSLSYYVYVVMCHLSWLYSFQLFLFICHWSVFFFFIFLFCCCLFFF